MAQRQGRKNSRRVSVKKLPNHPQPLPRVKLGLAEVFPEKKLAEHARTRENIAILGVLTFALIIGLLVIPWMFSPTEAAATETPSTVDASYTSSLRKHNEASALGKTCNTAEEDWGKYRSFSTYAKMTEEAGTRYVSLYLQWEETSWGNVGGSYYYTEYYYPSDGYVVIPFEFFGSVTNLLEEKKALTFFTDSPLIGNTRVTWSLKDRNGHGHQDFLWVEGRYDYSSRGRTRSVNMGATSDFIPKGFPKEDVIGELYQSDSESRSRYNFWCEKPDKASPKKDHGKE